MILLEIYSGAKPLSWIDVAKTFCNGLVDWPLWSDLIEQPQVKQCNS